LFIPLLFLCDGRYNKNMKKNIILMIISILFCGALALGGTFLFSYEQKIENPTIEVPEYNDELDDEALPGLTLKGYEILSIYSTYQIYFNTVKTATNTPTLSGYYYYVYAQYKEGVSMLFADSYYFFRKGTISVGGMIPGNDTVVVPTADGYTFSGYYTGQNGTGTLCVDASGNWKATASIGSSTNITLYAYWKSETSNNVDININYTCQATNLVAVTVSGKTLSPTASGTLVSDRITLTKSDTAVNLTFTLASSSYKYLMNVYEAESSNIGLTDEPITTMTISIVPDESKIIVVDVRQAYKVTYYANGGDGATYHEWKTHDWSLYVRSCNFTRVQYKFSHWNTASNGSGTSYTIYYTANADVNLYAIWQLISSYTLQVLDNAGSLDGVTSMAERHGAWGEYYNDGGVDFDGFSEGYAYNNFGFKFENYGSSGCTLTSLATAVTMDMMDGDGYVRAYSMCKVTLNLNKKAVILFDIDISCNCGYENCNGGGTLYFGNLGGSESDLIASPVDQNDPNKYKAVYTSSYNDVHPYNASTWGGLGTEKLEAGTYTFWLKFIPRCLSSSCKINFGYNLDASWSVSDNGQDEFKKGDDGYWSNAHAIENGLVGCETWSVIDFVVTGDNQTVEFDYVTESGVMLYFSKLDTYIDYNTALDDSNYQTYLAKNPISSAQTSYVRYTGVDEGRHFVYVLARTLSGVGEVKFRSDNFVNGVKTIPAGSQVGLLPTSGTRTGYTFNGFNTKSNGTGTKVEETTIPAADTAYYAQWKPIEMTAYFEGDGYGTPNPESKTVAFNQAYGTMPVLEYDRIGYVHNGWRTTIVEKDVTMSSSTSNYNYTRIVNGLTSSANTYDIYIDKAEITSGTATKFACLLYDFTNDKILASAQHVFGSDIKLTLEGTAASGTDIAIIIYSGVNGSTSGNATKYTGVKIVDHSQNFATSTTKVFKTEDHHLYPVWEEAEPYYVDFDKNTDDATGTMEKMTCAFNVTYNLNKNQFIRWGYTFAGWNREADGSGIWYTDQESFINLTTVPGSTVMLYAQWEIDVGPGPGPEPDPDPKPWPMPTPPPWPGPGGGDNGDDGGYNPWPDPGGGDGEYPWPDSTFIKIYLSFDNSSGVVTYSSGQISVNNDVVITYWDFEGNKLYYYAATGFSEITNISIESLETLGTGEHAKFEGFFTCYPEDDPSYFNKAMDMGGTTDGSPYIYQYEDVYYGQDGYDVWYSLWSIQYDVTVKIVTVSKTGIESNSTTGGSVYVTYRDSIFCDEYGVNETINLDSETINLASETIRSLECSAVRLVATAAEQYVFLGYDSARDGEVEKTINSVAAPMTITAYFKEVSTNKLKYDSTQKYFYFEEGYFPQSYVGDELNYDLNQDVSVDNINRTWSIPSLNKDIKIVLYEEAQYDIEFTNDVEYDLAYLEGYWFLIEPIRWRVSDYGVENTPNNWKTYGSYNTNFTVVSDTVLWVSTFSSSEPTGEGYSASNDAEINKIFAGMTDLTSGNIGGYWTNMNKDSDITIDDEEFKSVTSTPKVKPSTATVKESTGLEDSTLRVASMAEIKSCSSNMKAKASDLVAMLMGQSGDVKYWTRNLGQYYGNGNYVSVAGQPANGFYNNVYGVRFTMTMTEGSNAGF